MYAKYRIKINTIWDVKNSNGEVARSFEEKDEVGM